MRTRTIPLTFLLSIFAILLVAPVALAANLTVTTNAATYAPGDTITVSGVAVANTDVTVQLLNPNSQLVDMNYVKSGSDGSYSMTFVIPASMPTGQWIFGTYTVKAFMATTTASTTVAIQQKIAVTGTVVDSTGAALSGATVTIGTASATTAADGTFTVGLSAAGSYTMTVTKSNYYTYTAPVSASIGTTSVGTITLSSLADKIAALQSQINAMNSTITSQQSTITSLQSSIASMNSTITSLQAISSLVSQLQTTTSTLQTTVTSLQATVAQLPIFYVLAFVGIIIAVIAVILVYRKIAK
jgi:hypothetical protein